MEHNRAVLSDRIVHLRAQQNIVSSEMAEAQLERTRAEGVVTAMDARIEAVEAEIQAKRAELTAARLELGGAVLGTVFEVIGAAVAVVGAVYTGGTSLAAVPGLLAAAESSWSSITTDDMGNLISKGTALVDLVDWYDAKGNFNPKLKPEFDALAGGLKKVVDNWAPVVKGSLDLIDKAKVLADIDTSTVNGSLEHEYKQLLRKAAELAFERAQAKIVQDQADLHIKTVELKVAQAEADLASAQSLLARLSNDNVLLGRVARLLVRRAQEYLNYLMQFRFCAMRALEIYAHRDYSSSLAYEIGFVSPDQEEDAYRAFAQGDASRALALLDAYLTSWSRLPNLIVLRSEYEAYRQRLGSESLYWIFTDAQSPDGPGLLQRFRQDGSLEFDIELDDLREGRYECKLESVAVALVGATSNAPRISCVLMHEGTSRVRCLDGSVKSFLYPPRGASLQAVKSEADLATQPPAEPEGFWGRSPATRWRLYIAPEVMASTNVNLAGLTKVIVEVTYKACIPELGVAARAASA